jgi:hypothetical protein
LAQLFKVWPWVSAMQQQLVGMVTEYVYRRITIEYDNPELGKLAVAIINTLLSKGEAMPDEKIASTLGVNAVEVRRVLHLWIASD